MAKKEEKKIPEEIFTERYLLQTFQILFEGEEPEEVLGNHINTFSITKDYDGNCFPLFHINLSMKTTTYNKIIQTKDKVKFRIRLDKYRYNPNNENDKSPRGVFNDIFNIYIDEDKPFMDKEEYKKTKDIDGGTTGPNDFSPNVDLFLFKSSHLSGGKNVINKVVKSSNLMTVVCYMLASSGFTQLLMDTFDNKDTLSDLIIPPLPLVKCLYYFDYQFGFYNNGSVIFFDYDCGYFLKKQSKCSVFRPNEIKQTIFLIKKPSNAESTTGGYYEDGKEKKFYINVAKNSIDMSNNSIVMNQLEGNTRVHIDPMSGGASTKNLNLKGIGKSAMMIDVNNTGNKFKGSIDEIERIENACVLNVTVGDIDLEALTPNKEFMFVFEEPEVNSQYGGKYRLSNAKYSFKKMGDNYAITGNLIMKKTP